MNDERLNYLKKQIVLRCKNATYQRHTMKELTERESQVLLFVAAGEKTFAISDRLGISERTVNFHRVNILKKLYAKNTAHVVMLSFKLEILVAEDFLITF